jgi:uncharacterized delta-60 repeat protein
MKTKLILLSLLCAGLAHAANFLDTSFNPGTGANGLIETVLPLPNGQMLVCGNFTTFNGTSSSYCARLNSNGSLDTTFNASPSYWVRTMSLQSDGKIVIGGFFTSVSGASRHLIARLNSDGSLDPSLDPGTGATGVLGVAVDGDADPFVFATAIQNDGKILITGNFTNYDGTDMYGIARLNSNGTLDTNFNVGAGFNVNSWGRSLLVQTNGQIMATGWFTSYNNQSYNRMVRINPNGSADDTFNPFFGDLTAIYDALELGNGEYLAVGDSQNTNLFTRCIARLENNGAFDDSFVGQDNTKTETVRFQTDGKILIGGYFSEVDGVTQNNLARLNSDGTLDATYTPSIDNFVWSMAVQPNDRVVIVGGFANVEGASRNSIARLLPTASNTTPATNPPPANTFQSLAGTYVGLFYNPNAFTNADAGYISLTVGPHGGYTAGLNLNGRGYAWSGVFDTNLTAQKTLYGINGNSVAIFGVNENPIAINLNLVNNNTLQGAVTLGSLTSQLTAYRSPFNSTNPATGYAARYSAVLGGGSGGAPIGDGVMAVTVNALGAVGMGGVLPDGAIFSRSTWLSDSQMAPFYLSYANGTAAALGWLTLNAGAVQGSIYWQKGFSTTLTATGSPYRSSSPGHRALALTNALLTLSGGDLPSPIQANLTVQPGGNFTFASSTNHFSAVFSPLNGSFIGTFFDPAGHRYEGFRGIVLQDQNEAAGYFGPQGGLVTIQAP